MNNPNSLSSGKEATSEHPLSGMAGKFNPEKAMEERERATKKAEIDKVLNGLDKETRGKVNFNLRVEELMDEANRLFNKGKISERERDNRIMHYGSGLSYGSEVVEAVKKIKEINERESEHKPVVVADRNEFATDNSPLSPSPEAIAREQERQAYNKSEYQKHVVEMRGFNNHVSKIVRSFPGGKFNREAMLQVFSSNNPNVSVEEFNAFADAHSRFSEVNIDDFRQKSDFLSMISRPCDVLRKRVYEVNKGDVLDPRAVDRHVAWKQLKALEDSPLAIEMVRQFARDKKFEFENDVQAMSFFLDKNKSLFDLEDFEANSLFNINRPVEENREERREAFRTLQNVLFGEKQMEYYRILKGINRDGVDFDVGDKTIFEKYPY